MPDRDTLLSLPQIAEINSSLKSNGKAGTNRETLQTRWSPFQAMSAPHIYPISNIIFSSGPTGIAYPENKEFQEQSKTEKERVRNWMGKTSWYLPIILVMGVSTNKEFWQKLCHPARHLRRLNGGESNSWDFSAPCLPHIKHAAFDQASFTLFMILCSQNNQDSY